MSEVFDSTVCELGEGPLWHPTRDQLFWFDILGARLLTQEGGKTREVRFDEYVSAAGWADDSQLLIASETRLILFDLETERREDVEGLEADNPRTRSNDGRVDPWGGFWIGTMGKDAAKGAGAIHRYYEGRVTKLVDGITIPNAICFSPNRQFAYYADTLTSKIMRQKLEPKNGWPEGEAEVWLDLSDEGLLPDGAVVDAAGNLWNAQWGAARVACYDPDGEFVTSVGFNAAHTSCPAFGGPGLTTLFCTSALELLSAEERAGPMPHGMTFAAPETGKGQAEHRVLL
ncbi:MAG: SMP-30/gluconolactonase/LRE family protein [Paracoccaceae bacterium]|nr:SMP-30/gluconolactonase/LRE family protein [Paracoccaceae bacterium]